MAIKIAVTNHKGGVGKTMTTFNLGAALAELGEKVLLIDSDGQCNLTMQSGANVEGASNLSTYLNDDDVEIKPVSINENLWIIPGSTALDEDAHNIELSIEDDINGATHYLADILKKIENSYNYILIDSAPGSGAILVNVIVAADKLIVPIADKFSITGAKKLTREMALELIEYIKVDAHPGHRNLPRTIHVFYKLIDKPLTNKRNALE